MSGSLQLHGLQHPGLPLSFTISWSLLKLKSMELVMPSSHLILCHPLLLLPSILPSIRVFSNESALHTRWPRYWSFRFSNNPSNEYSGLISSRTDWLDLLAAQETLRVLPHLSFPPNNLWCNGNSQDPLQGTCGFWLLLPSWSHSSLGLRTHPPPGSPLTTSSHHLCALVSSCPPTNGGLSSSHSVSLDDHIHFILLTLPSYWQLPKMHV